MTSGINGNNAWALPHSIMKRVLSDLGTAGAGHQGDWLQNPVFDYFDKNSEIPVAGFLARYAKPEYCDVWGAGKNNEVVLIISKPGINGSGLTDVHYHHGGTIIAGLGKSFGFGDPQTKLLRGMFQVQYVSDPRTEVRLDAFTVKDGGFTAINCMEPHGFITRPGTTTMALAVTLDQFKDGDGQVDATIIDNSRCWVRQKNCVPLPIEQYADYFIKDVLD